MKSLLIEALDNFDLLKGDTVNELAVEKMSTTDILDFSLQSIELTTVADINRENSTFAHTASIGLGGGRSPCEALNCRIDRAYELGQYVTFYADKVYIKNFLADFASTSENFDEDLLRQRFYNDLRVIAQLRPLIETNRVIPVSEQNRFCGMHLAEICFGENADMRFVTEYVKLQKKYFDETSITLQKINDFYSIKIEAPELLLDHGYRGFIGRPPASAFDSMPGLLNRLLAGEEVTLNKKARKKIDLHSHLTEEVFNSIIFEMACSQSLNTSFLTHNDLEVNILNTLSQDSEIVRRNGVVQKHLTSLVPFIDDISLDDVMKIRDREGDSFILFRSSLNKAVDEYRAKKGDNEFTEKDAQIIYSEVIEPAIARLSNKVKAANRGFKKIVRRKPLSWVGAVSFGVYAGFVTKDVVAAAAALGLTKVLADLSEQVMAQSDIEESIRTEDMYFLWKVKPKS